MHSMWGEMIGARNRFATLGTVAVLVFAAVVACGLRRTSRVTIEIAGDRTVEEKIKWAETHITEARLVRLREQLIDRVPGITKDQLADLGLGWNETTFQSFTGQGTSKRITVWIGIQYDEGFNPEPVMTSATEILKADLNEFLAAPTPKVAP